MLWHDGPSGTPTSLLPAGEIPVQATDLPAPASPAPSWASSTRRSSTGPRTPSTWWPRAGRGQRLARFHQRIHAIDIRTGADRVAARRSTRRSPTRAPNPVGNGTVVSFDPKQYKERDALTLSNGVVYTGWASNADPALYGVGHRVPGERPGPGVGPQHRPQRHRSRQHGDGPSGGTFWNSGGGFAVDSAGNLYNASANGPFDAAAGDYGDSILKLSTADGLAVSDYFTPTTSRMLSDKDSDLGSSDVILLPDLTNAAGQTVQLAVTAGKDGSIYVVNRANLGRFNADLERQTTRSLPDVLGAPRPARRPISTAGSTSGRTAQPLRAFTIANAQALDRPDVADRRQLRLSRGPRRPSRRTATPTGSSGRSRRHHGRPPRLRREQPGARALQQQPGRRTGGTSSGPTASSSCRRSPTARSTSGHRRASRSSACSPTRRRRHPAQPASRPRRPCSSRRSLATADRRRLDLLGARRGPTRRSAKRP